MRRCLLSIAALLAVVASGCASTESHAMPDCALERGSAVLLMAQSVGSAELVPCVEALPPGWNMTEVAAGDDGAELQFTSDRLGDQFLTVEFTASCPVDAAAEAQVVTGGIAWLSQEVEEGSPGLQVSVVLRAPRHTAYGVALAAELRSLGIPTEVPTADEPASVRIQRAHHAGSLVVEIDDDLRADAKVRLLPSDGGEARTLDEDDAVELLRETATDASDESYRGTWQYRFEGGCVTYRFDAGGPGATSLPDTVTTALSFVTRNELRRFTRAEVGLELDG